MNSRLPWLMLLVLVSASAAGDDVVCETRTFGAGPLLLMQPRCVRVTPAGEVVLLQGRNESIRGAVLTPDGKQAAHFGVSGRPGRDPSRWYFPASLRPTHTGDLLVADTGNRRILRFDARGTFKRVVVADGLEGPTDVIELSSGDLVVCDSASSRVLLYTADGVLKRVVASPGETPENVQRPFSLALDGDGDLWTVDTLNRRLVERGRDLAVKRVVAPRADDGPLLACPSYLDFDRDGNLLVADDVRECVLKLSPRGELLKRIGLTPGEPRPFSHVSGVAVTSTGDLLVSDVGRNCVFRFDADGKLAGTLGLANRGIRNEDALTAAVAPDGSCFIVRAQPVCAVESYAPDGTFRGEFGGHGRARGKLRRPRDAAVAPDGNLCVADSQNHNVTVYRPDGVLVRIIGKPGRGPGELRYPRTLALAKDGTLFIGDAGNRRVQCWRPDGTFLGTLARDVNPYFIDVDDDGNCAVWDDADRTVSLFDATGAKRWTAAAKEIDAPTGLVTAAGRVRLLGREEGKMLVLDATGTSTVVWTDARLAWATRFLRGRDGREYVMTRDALCRLNVDGKVETMVTLRRELEPGQLLKPASLALVGDDALAVLSSGTGSVTVFGRDGTLRRSFRPARAAAVSLVRTPAGELRLHDAFDGTLSRVDDDGKTTAVLASPLLKNAGSCTFGPTGEIYVLSWDRGGVLKLDAAGKELGFLKANRDENTFRWPRTLAVSPDGDLLVVDWRHGRLFCYGPGLAPRWQLDPQDAANGGGRGRGEVAAVAVDRAGNLFLLSHEDGRVLRFDRERRFVGALRPDEKRHGSLRRPDAMTLDADGNVFIADTGNNRIVVLKPR